MKSLKHYLMEGIRTYHYKVKIVGDYPEKTMDMLRMNLGKFSPVKIGDAVKTPIQAKPWDFPNFENQAVTIMDCEFQYPATEPMVKQMWRLCGHDENRIRLVDSTGSEIENRQEERIHDGADYEAEAKNASRAYGNSYLEWLKAQREDTKYPQQFDAATTSTHDAFKVDQPKSLSPISGKNRRT